MCSLALWEQQRAPTAWLKTMSLRRVSVRHWGKLQASSCSSTKVSDCLALLTTSPMQSFRVRTRGLNCSYQSSGGSKNMGYMKEGLSV